MRGGLNAAGCEKGMVILMKKIEIGKRLTMIICTFILLIAPFGAIAAAEKPEMSTAHTHSYAESEMILSFSALDKEWHKLRVRKYKVCTLCGDTQEISINDENRRHAFRDPYYTGANQHVGSSHKVQYAKKCWVCEFTDYWWSDPYPCPGNGNCIVPYSIEPEEK